MLPSRIQLNVLKLKHICSIHGNASRHCLIYYITSDECVQPCSLNWSIFRRVTSINLLNNVPHDQSWIVLVTQRSGLYWEKRYTASVNLSEISSTFTCVGMNRHSQRKQEWGSSYLDGKHWIVTWIKWVMAWMFRSDTFLPVRIQSGSVYQLHMQVCLPDTIVVGDSILPKVLVSALVLDSRHAIISKVMRIIITPWMVCGSLTNRCS